MNLSISSVVAVPSALGFACTDTWVTRSAAPGPSRHCAFPSLCGAALQLSPDPVPIFGKGLIHQLLAAGENGRNPVLPADVRALADWGFLLREVASENHLLDAWNPFVAERPTLLWDELVRRRVALLGGDDSPERAAEAEAALRASVVRILREATSAAERLVDPSKLNDLLMCTGRHIVSLNFDTFLLAHEDWKADGVGATPRVPLSVSVHDKTLWFPHGCVAEPRSIKLGLRDYGFQPSDWNSLFEEFKDFEAALSPHQPNRTDPAVRDQLFRALRQGGASPAQTFMGHMMLAPLIFFGVGLSRDEWGWWWLLNQRARNLARVPERHRPPTVIVLHEASREAGFWVSRPAGVVPIFVPDWNVAWDVLLTWLERHRAEVPAPAEQALSGASE